MGNSDQNVNSFDEVDETARFLSRLPHDVINLVALSPEGDEPPVAITERKRNTSALLAFINSYNGLRNIYFTANQVRPGFGDRKPKKQDIGALTMCWVDLDPDAGCDFASERYRLRKLADKLLDDDFFAPSMVIDSGGGYQVLWFLDPLDAAHHAEALEAQNRGLALKFGGDAVHNIDRLLRVPGTMNLPSKKKRAAGRAPQRATLIANTKVSYALPMLAGLAPPVAETQTGHKGAYDGALLWPPEPPSAQVMRKLFNAMDHSEILRQRYDGDTAGLQDTSRSGLDFALARALKANGLSAEETAALMYEWPHGRGADMDERYFRRAWGRNSATSAREEFDEVDIADPPEPDEVDALTAAANVNEAEELEWIDPTSYEGQPIPDRQWVVEDFIPCGYTTSLYGDGGMGKTLLAQQLATSVATGTFWLGMEARQGRVLAVFCEDAPDELQRRQSDINRHYGLTFRDAGNMRWVSRVGKDNVLTTFDKNGNLGLTKFGRKVLRLFLDFKPTLFIVDTAADTFGGNENSRSDVRRFLSLLNGLAQKMNEWGGGAVLLCAHPSRDGMSSGRGDGGNTAWNNSVRSRLLLERPEAADGPPDPNARVLRRKKANYAAADADIPLRWDHGCLVPDMVDFPAVPEHEPGQAHDAPQRSKVAYVAPTPEENRRTLNEAVLRSLDTLLHQRVVVSMSPHAQNYAAKAIRSLPNMSRWRYADIAAALRKLFDTGEIAFRPAFKDAQRRTKETVARVSTTVKETGD